MIFCSFEITKVHFFILCVTDKSLKKLLRKFQHSKIENSLFNLSILYTYIISLCIVRGVTLEGYHCERYRYLGT